MSKLNEIVPGTRYHKLEVLEHCIIFSCRPSPFWGIGLGNDAPTGVHGPIEAVPAAAQAVLVMPM